MNVGCGVGSKERLRWEGELVRIWRNWAEIGGLKKKLLMDRQTEGPMDKPTDCLFRSYFTNKKELGSELKLKQDGNNH